MKNVVRGRGRLVAVALVAALLLPFTVLVQSANATATFALNRLAGSDRFATAAAIATTAFSSADTAIIATGFNYPDALAASFAAGSAGTPILLVNVNDPVPSATLAALSGLKVKNIVIVGGTDVVGSDVQSTLAATTSTNSAGGSLSVIRVAGATRYDTMEDIDTAGAAVGTFNGKNTAFIATGQDFPDALGAAPISYADHFPIILTEPDALSSQAAATLTALHIQQVLILGGTGAVSSTVESAINAMGIPTLMRFSGVDRSDTSKQVADYAITNLKFSDTLLNVASGAESYGGADAIASGPLGGTTLVPTLITNTTTDPGQDVNFAQEHSTTLTGGNAVGGTLPLPDTEVEAIETAGGNTTAPAPGSTTTSGSITLQSATVAPGGTINGLVNAPSTVSTIIVNGCGLTNSTVTFSASTGAFAVTLPATQGVGTCTLTFSVTFNNGAAAETDPFTITVTTGSSTALCTAQTSDGLAAPSLCEVTVARNPTGTNDQAVFTFDQTLSNLAPSPDDFRLYRGAGEYAFGTGVESPSSNSWTVLFPPGSVVNATLGSVLAGAVTNTAGDANFPTSVPVTGSLIQGPPPNVSATTQPQVTVTTNDTDLTTASLGSQIGATADNVQLVTCGGGCTAAFTATYSFDKPIVVPSTPVAQREPDATTVYFCEPASVTPRSAFEVVQATGTAEGEASLDGFPSAYTSGPYPTNTNLTCSNSSSVTAVFAGTASGLTLAAGAVKQGRVEVVNGDPNGNPLAAEPLSGATATPTWPILQEALEVNVPNQTTSVQVEAIFNQQNPVITGTTSSFELIEGDGSIVTPAALPTHTVGNSSALTFLFSPAAVSRAVGFAIQTGAIGTNPVFPDSWVPMTGAGAPVNQVDIPQLVGFTTTAGSSFAAGSITFTFDRALSNLDVGLADGNYYHLYNTNGQLIDSGEAGGTIANGGTTVTFAAACPALPLAPCAQAFSAADITAVAGGAGSFQDTTSDNPPPAPEQTA